MLYKKLVDDLNSNSYFINKELVTHQGNLNYDHSTNKKIQPWAHTAGGAKSGRRSRRKPHPPQTHSFGLKSRKTSQHVRADLSAGSKVRKRNEPCWRKPFMGYQQSTGSAD